jgi:hypothetical protein
MNKHEILSKTTFGHRVAEDETDALVSYFVETDHWKRIYKGEVDIVYGLKGAGKSAIYSLLLSKKAEFYGRGIVLVAAGGGVRSTIRTQTDALVVVEAC